MLVLTTTVSLVLTSAALRPFSTMTHCGMDSSVVVVGGEAPCCTHPNMPWFIKTLNETTTEDIELRLCKDHISPGDTPLELIELFVQ